MLKLEVQTMGKHPAVIDGDTGELVGYLNDDHDTVDAINKFATCSKKNHASVCLEQCVVPPDEKGTDFAIFTNNTAKVDPVFKERGLNNSSISNSSLISLLKKPKLIRKKCSVCNGSGNYRNHKYQRTCIRCGGKGWMSAADQRRYDEWLASRHLSVKMTYRDHNNKYILTD